MEITKSNEMYERLLETLRGRTVTITRENALEIYKQNTNIKYPFAYDMYKNEDGDLGDKYYDAKKKEPEMIKNAKAGKDDAVSDFNLFSLKYYDKEYSSFNIPLVEVAKNYFLCYENNLDNFRKGVENLDHSSQLAIYEALLKTVRDSVVEELCTAIENDPYKMDLGQIYNWLGINKEDKPLSELRHQIKREANIAKEIIETLKQAEQNAADHVIASGENQYSVDVKNNSGNFSKQMFIDVLENEFTDKPIVKKAISKYVETQSERALIAQMEAVVNHGKDNKHKDVLDKFNFGYDFGKNILR